MNSATFVEKKQHISTSTSYQLWSMYMNSSVYQSILESNTIPFVQHLQLDWNWALQQETEPKLSSNSTTKLLKRKKKSRCCKCPDLNPTEILWRHPKRAAHKEMPKNLNEPNQCCKEKCVKNPLQHCEKQKKMYCSIKLLLLKMALQATESWGGLIFHRTLWGPLFFIDCMSGLYVGLMLHVITCLFVCGGVFVNPCQCLHFSVSEHFSAWNA